MSISFTKSADFLMAIICLVAILTVLHASHVYADMESSSTAILSPLNQFQSGTAPKDVTCNNGLALILSATDGSPACVMPASIPRLFSQGWAENNFVGISQMTLNSADFNKIGHDPITLANPDRPVFFIKPNSTAQIYVYYDSNVNSAAISLKAEHGYGNGTSTAYTPYLSVQYIPKSAAFLQNGYRIAMYTLDVKNTTGMYWIHFPGMCISYPIAVGLDSSQVSPSEIAFYNGPRTCPGLAGSVHILGISGGTAEYVAAQLLP